LSVLKVKITNELKKTSKVQWHRGCWRCSYKYYFKFEFWI